jgi:hypothetical protein
MKLGGFGFYIDKGCPHALGKTAGWGCASGTIQRKRVMGEADGTMITRY